MLASKPSYCLGALSFPRAAWECIRDALRPVTPQPTGAAVLAHTRRSAWERGKFTLVPKLQLGN
ncbi:hypothetical protein Mettu_4167 [Methylobacter tundripaludum SV96]|uniref:Uncharacterized protein n=1 Tax=Methylobacter tundripaludum (strain ATCC BAA-1195 / DSM 17260 / SV96) TaxID=697282 RepID=G3J1E2_METTV|nr:hypothetical protein Mettu_4167 [Methylobacter tundripaludum SV96]